MYIGIPLAPWAKFQRPRRGLAALRQPPPCGLCHIDRQYASSVL